MKDEAGGDYERSVQLEVHPVKIEAPAYGVDADGGVLLLSAYSEAEEPESQRLVFNVARQRLLDRGVPPETVEAIVESRNKVVFSMDPSQLSTVLAQAGWPSPLQLYQGLFIRLWLCRAQS